MTNPFMTGPAAPAATAPAAPAATTTAAPANFGSVAAAGSDDPYSISTPSVASGLKMDAPGIIDTLMLVEVLEYIPSMDTAATKEPTDAFRVNILPLEGQLANQLQEDAMVFQSALKRKLKDHQKTGARWLLAYLCYGAKKPGKNAPYIFQTPTEAQVAQFNSWKAARTAAG